LSHNMSPLGQLHPIPPPHRRLIDRLSTTVIVLGTAGLLAAMLAGVAFALYLRAPSNADVAGAREAGREAGYAEGVPAGASQAAAAASESHAAEIDTVRDKAYDAGVDDGYDEGLTEGRSQGYEQGRADGESAGYEAGYSAGYSAGVAGRSAASADRSPIYGDDPYGYYGDVFSCMIDPQRYAWACDNVD
jgi:hypothetical protein